MLLNGIREDLNKWRDTIDKQGWKKSVKMSFLQSSFVKQNKNKKTCCIGGIYKISIWWNNQNGLEIKESQE